MNKIRLLLAALLMLALPTMAHAQTAVDWETTAGGALANPWVQKKNCPNVTPNGSHVATCAFTSNVTSGDKEVAIVFVNSATIAINSASGSNCGSMSAKGSPTLAAPSTAGFVCTAATSAAETISVTLASGTPSTTIELFEIPSTYTYDSVGTVTTGTQASTSVSATVTDASELLIGGVGVSASVAKTGINVQCNDVGDDGTTNPSSYFFTTVSGAVGQSPTCTVTTTASHATNGIMLSFESPVQPKFVPDGTPTTTIISSASGTVNLPSGLSASDGSCMVIGCANNTYGAGPGTLAITGGSDTWTLRNAIVPWGAGAQGGTISTIVGASGTATVSLTANCSSAGSAAGGVVTIVGNSVPAFNGVFTITSATGCAGAQTLTFATSTTGTGTGGLMGNWPSVVYTAQHTAASLTGPTVTGNAGSPIYCASVALTGPTGTTCPVIGTPSSLDNGAISNPNPIYAPSDAGASLGQVVWWFSSSFGLNATPASFSLPQPQNGNPLVTVQEQSSGIFSFAGHIGTYPLTIGTQGSPVTLSQYGVVPSVNANDGLGQEVMFSAATPTPTATATATPTATATATATATSTATATPTATSTGPTPTATATATATPTATSTGATATPTPAGSCTPNAGAYLVNPSNKVMNGTASATTGTANFSIIATDTSGFLVNSFSGSASSTTSLPNFTIQFVDNAGKICSGNDSSTPALPQRTYRACDSNHKVVACPLGESATSASPNYSINIIDANGFVDDSY